MRVRKIHSKRGGRGGSYRSSTEQSRGRGGGPHPPTPPTPEPPPWSRWDQDPPHPTPPPWPFCAGRRDQSNIRCKPRKWDKWVLRTQEEERQRGGGLGEGCNDEVQGARRLRNRLTRHAPTPRHSRCTQLKPYTSLGTASPTTSSPIAPTLTSRFQSVSHHREAPRVDQPRMADSPPLKVRLANARHGEASTLVHIAAYDAAVHTHPLSCPFCANRVIPKRGLVNVHHYAHAPGAECVKIEHDNAGKGEWHTAWQACADVVWREVEYKAPLSGRARIRDVANPTTGACIEFQASPLTEVQIAAREEDYGAALTWVVDARDTARVLAPTADGHAILLDAWRHRAALQAITYYDIGTDVLFRRVARLTPHHCLCVAEPLAAFLARAFAGIGNPAGAAALQEARRGFEPGKVAPKAEPTPEHLPVSVALNGAGRVELTLQSPTGDLGPAGWLLSATGFTHRDSDGVYVHTRPTSDAGLAIFAEGATDPDDALCLLDDAGGSSHASPGGRSTVSGAGAKRWERLGPHVPGWYSLRLWQAILRLPANAARRVGEVLFRVAGGRATDSLPAVLCAPSGRIMWDHASSPPLVGFALHLHDPYTLWGVTDTLALRAAVAAYESGWDTLSEALCPFTDKGVAMYLCACNGSIHLSDQCPCSRCRAPYVTNGPGLCGVCSLHDRECLIRDQAKRKIAEWCTPLAKDGNRSGAWMDYPIISKFGDMLLDEVFVSNEARMYRQGYTCESDTDSHSRQLEQFHTQTLALPRVTQLDGNTDWVPTFDTCLTHGYRPLSVVDVAVPYKGIIREVWIVDVTFVSSEGILRQLDVLRDHLPDATVYVIDASWVLQLQQDTNLPLEGARDAAILRAKIGYKPKERSLRCATVECYRRILVSKRVPSRCHDCKAVTLVPLCTEHAPLADRTCEECLTWRRCHHCGAVSEGKKGMTLRPACRLTTGAGGRVKTCARCTDIDCVRTECGGEHKLECATIGCYQRILESKQSTSQCQECNAVTRVPLCTIHESMYRMCNECRSWGRCHHCGEVATERMTLRPPCRIDDRSGERVKTCARCTGIDCVRTDCEDNHAQCEFCTSWRTSLRGPCSSCAKPVHLCTQHGDQLLRGEDEHAMLVSGGIVGPDLCKDCYDKAVGRVRVCCRANCSQPSWPSHLRRCVGCQTPAYACTGHTGPHYCRACRSRADEPPPSSERPRIVERSPNTDTAQATLCAWPSGVKCRERAIAARQCTHCDTRVEACTYHDQVMEERRGLCLGCHKRGALPV